MTETMNSAGSQEKVSVKVLRTDRVFCGLAVPAGKVKVTLEYRPQSYTSGLIVTLLSVSLAIGIGLFRLMAEFNRWRGE